MRVHERQHVLALVERPDEEVVGRVAFPSNAGARLVALARAEQVHVHAAVDNMGLVPEFRKLGDESRPQPVRDGDHPAGAPRRPPRQRLGEPAALDVADVRPVGGQHRRHVHGPRRTDGGGPGERQEMAIDDVRLEPLGGPARVAREAQVLRPRQPAAVDRDDLELVPLRLELAADLRDERAEVGVGRARPHLTDDEDLQ
jgi:hypothetical protein